MPEVLIAPSIAYNSYLTAKFAARKKSTTGTVEKMKDMYTWVTGAIRNYGSGIEVTPAGYPVYAEKPFVQ